MSALAATTLLRAAVGEIVVANRTYQRAARVAEAVGGRAVPFDAVDRELAAADLVVSCTGADGLVIGAAQLSEALRERPARPIFLLDLALPRDVDPAVRGLDGAHLVDLERLSRLSDDRGSTAVTGDVDAVRHIVAEEVAAFAAWQRTSQVAPTVVALRTMAADVVTAELARLEGRLPQLGEHDRDEIAKTVRRVAEKLLHMPTVRVKELAGGPEGHAYATALRELFDLDRNAVEAVTRAESLGEGR